MTKTQCKQSVNTNDRTIRKLMPPQRCGSELLWGAYDFYAKLEGNNTGKRKKKTKLLR